jgi:hypothetical protein
MNEVTAYHIAGKLVATVHSQYHTLIGEISLSGTDGLSQNIGLDPVKWERNGGMGQAPGTDNRIASEKAILEITGYEAELIYSTIDAPNSMDPQLKASEELVERMVQIRAAELNISRKEIVVQALGLVTHNWYEIWNLSAYLLKSDKNNINADELLKVLADISTDHKRFLLY